MYRINPLMRNVLITVDEVIFHAPTKHSVDPRAIENSIIVAEERLIHPLLGYDLYEQLINQKNTLVTAENKAALQTQIQTSLPEGSETIALNEGDIVNAMEFLNADNLALWKQHLWKLTAECVMLLATPEAFVQFGAEGVIHTSPVASPLNTTGVSTPELRSVKWMMDKKMMDRVDPLMEALHVWLCRQRAIDKAKYPLYTKPCDCDANGVAYKRKSDLVMGLYDDEPNNCGCYD